MLFGASACGRFLYWRSPISPTTNERRSLKVNKKIVLVLLALLFFAQVALAAEGEIEEITAPLTRIYDLVKAVISVVAILAITFAGVKFMFSGDNIQAREGAKSMVGYCVAGLVIVWVAPLLVGYLTAPIPVA